jgi:hypothetical protein
VATINIEESESEILKINNDFPLKSRPYLQNCHRDKIAIDRPCAPRGSGGVDEPPERSTSTSVGMMLARGLPEHTVATSPTWKGAPSMGEAGAQGRDNGRRSRGAPTIPRHFL